MAFRMPNDPLDRLDKEKLASSEPAEIPHINSDKTVKANTNIILLCSINLARYRFIFA
jgi:hypothetical protein